MTRFNQSERIIGIPKFVYGISSRFHLGAPKATGFTYCLFNSVLNQIALLQLQPLKDYRRRRHQRCRRLSSSSSRCISLSLNFTSNAKNELYLET